jgi:hypothetical protein
MQLDLLTCDRARRSTWAFRWALFYRDHNHENILPPDMSITDSEL